MRQNLVKVIVHLDFSVCRPMDIASHTMLHIDIKTNGNKRFGTLHPDLKYQTACLYKQTSYNGVTG